MSCHNWSGLTVPLACLTTQAPLPTLALVPRSTPVPGALPRISPCHSQILDRRGIGDEIHFSLSHLPALTNTQTINILSQPSHRCELSPSSLRHWGRMCHTPVLFGFTHGYQPTLYMPISTCFSHSRIRHSRAIADVFCQNQYTHVYTLHGDGKTIFVSSSVASCARSLSEFLSSDSAREFDVEVL